MSLAFSARIVLLFGLAGSLVACPDAPRDTRLEGDQDICIVTQYTRNQAAFGTLAAHNHAAYAKRHGYSAFSYVGRQSGHRFLDPTQGNDTTLRGGGLYWQEVAVLEKALAERRPNGAPRCQWVMWVDADVLFTNFTVPLERRIEAYAPTDAIDVILSREEAGLPDALINAGAFFVRNSAGGRAFVQTLGNQFEAYKDAKLADQDAIHDYAFGVSLNDPKRLELAYLLPKTRADVALAPQRAFDAFHRPHVTIAPAAKWYPCDLVAHLAGMSSGDRASIMEELERSIAACEE